MHSKVLVKITQSLTLVVKHVIRVMFQQKSDPCLVLCPREKIVTVYQKPEQTPELIVIDQISDRYSPVYFSHKIHAQMSNMGGGCEGLSSFQYFRTNIKM